MLPESWTGTCRHSSSAAPSHFYMAAYLWAREQARSDAAGGHAHHDATAVQHGHVHVAIEHVGVGNLGQAFGRAGIAHPHVVVAPPLIGRAHLGIRVGQPAHRAAAALNRLLEVERQCKTTGLPDEPGRGMWQLGARFDHIDLNDGGLKAPAVVGGTPLVDGVLGVDTSPAQVDALADHHLAVFWAGVSP